MRDLHDARYDGPLETKRTIDLVKRDFYWPNLRKDVTEYVRTCDECWRNKSSNQKTRNVANHWSCPHEEIIQQNSE